MARVSSCVKLLNEDGSFRRWVYPREVADLLRSDSVHKVSKKSTFSLRLKVQPLASESEASPCMPTLADICIYAERRRPPAEVKAKIDACRPMFRAVYADLAEVAA